MKKVEATIRSSKLEAVTSALHEVGVEFFTYVHVKDISNQKPKEEVYRGQIHEVKSLSRLTLEILVSNDNLDKIVQAILSSAKTGELGDGKIFITTIDQAIRIRSGKTITEEEAY
jgi:nitrogen regulatory protein P-II 1